MRSKLQSISVAVAAIATTLIAVPASSSAQVAPTECDGVSATIVGTEGDDVLVGTNQSDIIAGLGGNDQITGGNGNDIICGDSGDDELEGGNGEDRVLGGAGNDVVAGDNGKDQLRGGSGVDTVDGGRGKDACNGGETTTSCEETLPTTDFLVEGAGGATAQINGFSGDGSDEVTIAYDVSLAGPNVADSLASPVYEFLLNDPAAEFDSAELTIPYYPELLANGDSRELEIYTFDEVYGLWVPVNGPQIVDDAAGTVSVTVDHFTKYAVFNLGPDGFERYWATKPAFCVQPGQDPTAGLDIAFAIDTSGSMGSNDPSGLRVDAALDIVDRASTTDRVSVIGFSSGSTIESELTEVLPSNLPGIQSALERTRRASGGTNITSAVQTATTVLTRDVTLRRPRIAILLTDGQSSYSQSATTAAAEANVNVYTVALGSNADTNLLQQIADGTGGLFLQADNAGDISDIYDEIASGLIDDGSDDDGDGLTNCEERRGMYTTDGFYIFINNVGGPGQNELFIPRPRTMTSYPDEVDSDTDGVTDDVEMGPALDLRDDPVIADTYDFLIDAGITRVYNPISNPLIKDNEPPPLDPGSISFEPSRTWAIPGGGLATAGKTGVVSATGTLLTGAIVGELLVQYFQTFDLDEVFRATYTTHLLPMIADIPGDDLDLQVTAYETLPWVEPATKPYRRLSDCQAFLPAVGGGMEAFIGRRATNPNISSNATLAVAIYCIDEKIGGAAARSGGPNAIPPDMPGLSVNPDLQDQRDAFDGTPQNHAETNLLGSLISGVPITTASVGVIYMFVDNPSAGKICGQPSTSDQEASGCIAAFESFKRRYPLVELNVRARNNAWQDGVYTDNIDPGLYDREVFGG